MLLRAVAGLAFASLLCGQARASPPAPAHEIAFAADRAPVITGEIFRVDLDGRRVNLTHSPFDDRDPNVSPDGKRVAFLSNRGASAEYGAALWVVGIDGRHLEPVAPGVDG